MKIYRILAVFLSLLVFASCRSARVVQEDKPTQPTNTGVEKQEDIGPFVLGPADQIMVTVWRNTELGRSLTVDPVGNINMPLAGEIRASGLTVQELQTKIAAALAKYIKNPQVDINVITVKSVKAYVFGEVKTPGTLLMDHRISPLEAISSAGGFTSDANKDKVLLIRSKDGQAIVTALNMDVTKGSGRATMTGDQHLRNGDVLYVLTLKIATVERFATRINAILSPIVAIERGIVMEPAAVDAVLGNEGNTGVTIAQ